MSDSLVSLRRLRSIFESANPRIRSPFGSRRKDEEFSVVADALQEELLQDLSRRLDYVDHYAGLVTMDRGEGESAPFRNFTTLSGERGALFGMQLPRLPWSLSNDVLACREIGLEVYAFTLFHIAGPPLSSLPLRNLFFHRFLERCSSWASIPRAGIEEFVISCHTDAESWGLAGGGQFASGTVGVFNAPKGVLTYLAVGEQGPLVMRPGAAKALRAGVEQRPAIGAVPFEMLEMQGSYEARSVRIQPADVVVVHSDSVARTLRISGGNERTLFRGDYTEKEATDPSGARFEVVISEDQSCVGEELSEDRVDGILNAIRDQKPYQIVKYNNSDIGTDFAIDFSQSELSPRTVVLGLFAAEQLFRVNGRSETPANPSSLVDNDVLKTITDLCPEAPSYLNATAEPDPHTPESARWISMIKPKYTVFEKLDCTPAGDRTVLAFGVRA